MRRWMMIAVLAAGGMAGAQAFAADLRCNGEAERSMFEVAALRSELMVLATGCQEAQRYNAFMRKFQPALMANEREISTYFKKHFGRSGQLEHDRFVTDLANARSGLGMRLGTDFCPRNGLLFSEVLSLQSANDLANYAASKDLIPASMPVCHTVTPVQTARAPASKPAAKSTRTAQR
ncbi:MAG: hypothetical protein AB7O80_06525 [Acetobacteraceae bacterium]